MMLGTIEEFPWAVLADIKEDTKAVRWEPEEIWHRPARWRGLRPGDGIPDDKRVARTLCARFIQHPFDQVPFEIEGGLRCQGCEEDYERGLKYKRGW